MIRVISYPNTVQTIDVVDENGNPVSLQIVVPPCNNAIRKGKSNIWFAFGVEELKEGANILAGAAKNAAIPLRSDLPEDHPLYNERSLTKVPAGYPDVVLRDSDKKLCFFDGVNTIDPDEVRP